MTQLILDLEQRSLLDRTLVVFANEFGRDMMVKSKPGQTVTATRHHDRTETLRDEGDFTEAGSAPMFGGGVKKGQVYTLLGIAPDTSYEVEKRPFYVTNNGKGKSIPAWLSSAYCDTIFICLAPPLDKVRVRPISTAAMIWRP